MGRLSDSISVFAVSSLVLGGTVLRNEKAQEVIKLALLASLLTIFIDMFFF